LYYGISCVIAPSFADIFYNNCFKNGILPVVLSDDEMNVLFAETTAKPAYKINIDLEKQTITTPSGQAFNFVVDKFRKHCLFHGLDDIALTLQQADHIKAYEEKRKTEAAWLF